MVIDIYVLNTSLPTHKFNDILGDILMPDFITDETLSAMDIEDKKNLRKILSADITKDRRTKSLRMEVYIPAEFALSVQTAKDWAFDKELIARNTKWTFAKFCIINTVRMILAQMEKEKAEKARAKNSQAAPTTYQQTDSGNQVM